MKTLFTIVTLGVCLFNLIEAAPESRQKRSTSREECPIGMSEKSCNHWAENLLKESGICQTFVLGKHSIEWQTCGSVSCGPGLKVGVEDLKKSYPDCCKQCVIDEDNPTTGETYILKTG